ncbi:hypothetical protein [Bradyrhizobium sp. WSM1743]|uniref:hypothetical protein n=1 Tax=Bradyrhizobium sp. WSM1743 TaxID=318996 RepID=UPI0012EC3EA0|nr:hypothetical protein [Bradyrhizobium sp. WSM1743]
MRRRPPEATSNGISCGKMLRIGKAACQKSFSVSVDQYQSTCLTCVIGSYLALSSTVIAPTCGEEASLLTLVPPHRTLD